MSRAAQPNGAGLDSTGPKASAGRRSWWQRAMDSDDARLWLVTGPAIVVGTGVSLLFAEHYTGRYGEGGLRAAVYLVLAVAWTLMYLGYIALTHRTFAREDAASLAERLRTRSTGERPAWLNRWGLGMGSTLTWAVSTTVGALLLVVAVMVDPVSRGDAVLRGLSVLLALVSWATVVISEALDYAREAAQHGGIEFADTPEPDFADYVSLSVFITTMMGTGDAELRGTRLRRTVRGHVLVAFAFNSIVVASLATLLLTT